MENDTFVITTTDCQFWYHNGETNPPDMSQPDEGRLVQGADLWERICDNVRIGAFIVWDRITHNPAFEDLWYDFPQPARRLWLKLVLHTIPADQIVISDKGFAFWPIGNPASK